ncbi:helix-turn-helix domain-containing protein [Clostridium paraputrificum]|uniref:helix-turn-helix domain-containing protein n=1 Tax=Clostridium paraputrificum TaxID=29363 RepID=UPI00232FAEFD|nr:helix-turn-helix domain-containing protein [Clostridium paraputrificum]MDB2071390.1 helix-turn-helix domain-containing protein [Clostridium paraputrificum]MDB2081697.1 helix-turn-helix domain-containing protein [Clostridium paraputrificum]
MQLSEKHFECINLLIKGYKITEIANKLPASRTAIYNWLADDEFKAELNKQKQEIKDSGKSRIVNKLDTYIDRIEDLALNATSEKTKLDATALLLAYAIGKPTNKQEIEYTGTDSNHDITEEVDNILEELDIEGA